MNETGNKNKTLGVDGVGEDAKEKLKELCFEVGLLFLHNLNDHTSSIFFDKFNGVVIMSAGASGACILKTIQYVERLFSRKFPAKVLNQFNSLKCD